MPYNLRNSFCISEFDYYYPGLKDKLNIFMNFPDHEEKPKQRKYFEIDR